MRTYLVVWAVLFTLAACKREAPPIPLPKAKELVHATGCTQCHDTTRKLVGPPFAAVALRYADEATAAETMLASLRHGSLGRWGAMPMPPQRVAGREAAALVSWIRSLRPAAEIARREIGL